jgi:tetratricopeptide (TPR) repeat protein
VVTNNLSLDEEVLNDLEAITQRYWRLSRNTSLDLFSSVVGHFETIIYLLKRSHPSHVSRRLYSLGSEIAQILGKMLFDIHEYSLAWSYYSFSLQAAHTAHNYDLQAVGLGRLGLLAIYNNQPEEALTFLEESQILPIQGARIRAWLAAVTAETHAHLDDFDTCKESLDTAEHITSEQRFEEDTYAIGFNESRLFGYKGVCFSRLGKAELALSSLQKALALLDQSAIRRRSMILADIGIVYAQQGNVKAAYTYASQALTITTQTRSLSVLQRLHTLRSLLRSQKGSSLVKNLDQQLRDIDQQIVAAKAIVIS